MFEVVAPTALQWLIGVELARYRNEAGLSLTQLADLCGIGKPKLSHLEHGRTTQYPGDIRRILAACRVHREDVDRITQLTTRAHEASWLGAWSDVVSDWLRTMIGLEALAHREFVFEPVLLPGLLQTEDYARALTAHASRVRPDQAERLVDLRMHRTLLLDKGLALHAVFTEQALRLRVGTPEVRGAQYRHLLALGERPDVTIQVVRPADGPHAAITGQFMLLQFVDARPICYVELQDAAAFVNDPPLVHAYTLTTQSLHEVALSPTDSATLIESLIT
ncbi:helix-turn-helix transcriptional regulator [Actinosynnema sp. NPDC047251]|uniref:Transcriptional regulator n=1 Tax=Saccharothrix espanaensis (strain ATCC 51144 / DSM 44229 / JCM 9112 / NBRC 15066 / NRRL 15764) TaxID=1179773 RepID=K0JRN8_SACES|nr:helix-turn-helix transcriptional regulator [Saccharothrix espanaensis]CCH28451.1 Transcriptional regulator [Saccharothrix espanaensis DSM 44229]